MSLDFRYNTYYSHNVLSTEKSFNTFSEKIFFLKMNAFIDTHHLSLFSNNVFVRKKQQICYKLTQNVLIVFSKNISLNRTYFRKM